MAKVDVDQERSGDSSEYRGPSVAQVLARRRTWTIKRKLRIAWIALVFFPWCLQVRSIVQLALPHSLSQLLVIGNNASQTKNVVSHCPVQGQMIAGVWWNIWPTHFAQNQNGETICHYVFPQYNSHGYYCIGSSSTPPPPEQLLQALPENCKSNESVIELFFYHGSIGYYSFYTAGRGVYCSEDATAYIVLLDLGSADLNGRVLAQDAGGEKAETPHTRYSYWYLCIGSLWIVYRAVVLHRSWVLCSQHGNRCERMKESLSNRGIVVFVQESARLVAHNANTLQRIIVLYALIEGLMADLFLQITKYGLSVRLQYFSIGYNLASLLSVLFDMIEGRWKGGKSSYVLLIARRVFFNLETGYLGEAACAVVLREYFDILNRSHFKDSLQPAPIMSYYFWSLVAHGIVAIGLTLLILTVRGFVALLVTYLRFRTFQVLGEPNCVDFALRGRIRGVMLSGYVWENGHLYYSRESLKAFGLFRSICYVPRGNEDIGIESDGQELLIHVDASWIGSIKKPNLAVVGSITAHCVEPFPARQWNGQVLLICDQMLGGSAAT